MRRSLLVLVGLLLGVAVAPYPQPPAAASCAGPALEQVTVLVRGTPMTVHGEGFVDGCRDTMTCPAGPGCGSCEYDEPPPAPLTDLELVLVQGQRSWRLGVEDAGAGEGARDGQVAWEVVVPADARPGRARLEVDGVRMLRVRVR